MKYYQMDFMENYKDVGKKSVDLIISSVPLDILENQFFTLINNFAELLRPTGFVIIDAPETMELFSKFTRLREKQNLLWVRSHHIKNAYPGDINQWMHVVKGRERHDYVPPVPGCLEPLREREMSHPCEFCPDLTQRFISAYSYEGDTVLDSFCGTGTVMGEAEKMGRKGIGCDLRPVENIREEYMR